MITTPPTPGPSGAPTPPADTAPTTAPTSTSGAPPIPPIGPLPADTHRQPWLGRPAIETIFILLPPFLSLAFIAAFPALFHDNGNIPDAWWVILILLIDVAHVYSTLYRTYLDPVSFRRYRVPLLLIPLLGFIGGTLLYWWDGLLFWRVLAYLAVFHFIRQQYGFMRIYSRQELAPSTAPSAAAAHPSPVPRPSPSANRTPPRPSPSWARRIDTLTIYYATLYPLLYWHLGEPRHFNWFVDDDFLLFRSTAILQIATLFYWLVLAAWLIREAIQLIQTRHLNIPRVAILSGTILSWYFGIIYFNGDMAFTLLNVVSHGIPYMALIWIYGQRQVRPTPLLQKVFSPYGILLFLGIIFLLAYLEEGLWDMTVWKEHVKLFSVFHLFGGRLHEDALIFVVPLLALPQLTHYIIDGFIWRSGGSARRRQQSN
ncbi:MAG TPA: hypothetical protein VKQ52_00760 [Puia sp.]|nr:hypothetical protein [Puia sp.]